MSAAARLPNSNPFASILVAVDAGAHAKHRLAVAFDLARRFSSHVIGIASREIQIPRYADGPIYASGEIVELEMKEISRNLAAAEAAFREAAGTYADIEWRSATARPLDFFLEQSRAADLAIVGAPGAVADAPPGMRLEAGDAVMSSGRPLLVVPTDVSRVLGRKIVVAWKDCREARRAVLDALPFLEIAEEVQIVIVGGDSNELGAKDMCAFLARHGVKPRLTVRTTSAFLAGEEILRVANQIGADLVVAGAYGHSRLREWALGGVTRHLLKNATMACFISH